MTTLSTDFDDLNLILIVFNALFTTPSVDDEWRKYKDVASQPLSLAILVHHTAAT